MKICFFIASKGFGGAEKVVVDLANELSSRIKVFALIPKGCLYEDRLCENVKILHYTQRSRYNPLMLIEIYNILKRLKPDLVHTHSSKATEIYSYIKRFLNIPYVATKHNNRKGKIFNKANSVIAVSREVEKSINNDNTFLIYNGIKPKDIQSKTKKEGVFKIVAIGRLDKIKGFDRLIREVAKLKFEYILEIVGSGEELDNLKILSESLKLENRVWFVGFKDEIDELMSSADLVVVSSQSEGFSLVLLESLFYANVAISTPVGIANEIFSEKLLVRDENFSKKITEVYEDYEVFLEEFLKIKSKKGSFLLDRCADMHLKVYEKVLKPKKRVGIMRFSALGDIALSVPVVKTLKNYDIYYITSAIGNELLEGEFNNIIVLKDKSLVSMVKLIAKIRELKLDMLFDLQCNDRSKFITSFLDCKIYNNKKIETKKNVFFEIVKQANLENRVFMDFKPKERSYIVLNCGSSQKWISKRLPKHKWREFSEVLYERFGLPFVLTGEKRERDYIEEIASELAGEVKVLAGETSIGELKKVLKGAFLTVSTDSAAMHISASFGTPTIGIFGPTNWIQSAPYGEWSSVLYDEVYFSEHRPLKKNSTIVDNYFENIDIEKGLEKIEKFIG